MCEVRVNKLLVYVLTMQNDSKVTVYGREEKKQLD